MRACMPACVRSCGRVCVLWVNINASRKVHLTSALEIELRWRAKNITGGGGERERESGHNCPASE